VKNVIILGSGRSGTSLAAGLLAKAGYYMGENLMPPTSGNPRGYFESFDIERINEDILRQVVPAKPRPLRFFFKSRFGRGQYWLANLRVGTRLKADSAMTARITALTGITPYCFKDPRFCYTLPVWRPLLDPETVFICVFRHPAETIASIEREWRTEPYLFDFPYSDERVLSVWKQMYAHILDIHIHSGRWLFIHYRQLLTSEGQKQMGDFTDADIDRSFADATLHRSKSAKNIPDDVGSMYTTLCSLADCENGDR
jgi:hypothetical protein